MRTYEVYASKLKDVTARLDRLARRAYRLGLGASVSYTVNDGSRHMVHVNVYDSDGMVSDGFYTEAVNVTVSCDLVKVAGWTVLAKIEAIGDADRRIVTTFGDVQAKPQWFTSDMHCDHCGTDHYRKIVYLCRHDDGREARVGKGCLKDYTGIDPTSLVSWAQVGDIFCRANADLQNDLEGGVISGALRWSADRVLALAADMVAEYGYVKSDQPNSTKMRVYNALMARRTPTPDGQAQATLIRDWLLTYPFGDVEQNCSAICEAGFAAVNHIGFLAYMPVAYQRMVDRRTAYKAAAGKSQHVGSVGDRIDIEVDSAKIVASWEGDFGMTYIWSITDKGGNVYVWKTNKGKGDMVDKRHIKATVKTHKVYDGVCQTEITRCRLA